MGFSIQNEMVADAVYADLADRKVKALIRKAARATANRFCSNDIEIAITTINSVGKSQKEKLEASFKVMNWLKSQDYLDQFYNVEEALSINGVHGIGLVWRLWNNEPELRLITGGLIEPESKDGQHTTSISMLSNEITIFGSTHFIVETFKIGKIERQINKGPVEKENGFLITGKKLEGKGLTEALNEMEFDDEIKQNNFLNQNSKTDYTSAFQIDNYPNSQNDADLYEADFETYRRIWTAIYREIDFNITRIYMKTDTLPMDNQSEISELSARYRAMLKNGIIALADIGEDEIPVVKPATARLSIILNHFDMATKIEDGILKDLGANSGGLKGGTFQSSKLETKTDFARKNEITSIKLKRNQRK